MANLVLRILSVNQIFATSNAAKKPALKMAGIVMGIPKKREIITAILTEIVHTLFKNQKIVKKITIA